MLFLFLTLSVTWAETLAKGLPLEAGGVVEWADPQRWLVVSDEKGPLGSPFWFFDPEKKSVTNLKMRGLRKVKDVEAVVEHKGSHYALSSLSPNKRGQIKRARNLILRFAIAADLVEVDRSLDLRTPLVRALMAEARLKPVADRLSTIEVEAFTFIDDDAIVALKEPRLPDGSSFLIKLKGLVAQIEKGVIENVQLSVHGVYKLQGKNCQSPSRVSDLTRVSGGMLILGNCSKIEKAGQVWWLADGAVDAVSVLDLSGGHPEGIAVSKDGKHILITMDNGAVRGSDFLRLKYPRVP